MKLYPDEYIRHIADYDFEGAYSAGRRMVLFDIDNTIVPHGYPADENAEKLFMRLRAIGYRLCAISNNREPRVKSFCDKVGVPYICNAKKPSASGFEKAISDGNVKKSEAFFFGDQIFTDIIGANNAGIYSILVKPIDRKTDKLQIKLKRIFEKPIVKAFFKYKNLAIGDYFR